MKPEFITQPPESRGTHPGRSNKAQSKYKCQTHTEGGRSSYSGSKQAQLTGFCPSHGGRRSICSHSGCEKAAVSRGTCGDHSGSRSKAEFDNKQSPKTSYTQELDTLSSLVSAKDFGGKHTRAFNRFMTPKSSTEFNAQEASGNADASIQDRDLFLLGDGVAALASAGIVMPISSARNGCSFALKGTIKPPKVEPTTVETRTIPLEQFDQTSTSSASADGDVVSKVHNPVAECVLGTCVQSGCGRTAVKDDKCFEHCGFQKCSYPECTRNVWDTTMCFKHEGWRRNFMLQNP